MTQYLRFLCGLLFVALVTACGGGGGSPGATTGGTTGGPTTGVDNSTGVPDSSTGGSTTAPARPAKVELFASSSQLSSSPNATVSFTVMAKDEQNRAIPGQTITFTASSGNLVGALPAPRTGAAGEPITSVSLSPGSDRSNRDIVVTATAGGVSQNLTISVAGTALSLSGEPSLLLGSTTSYTVSARDQGGQPILGAALNITSALGNSVTPNAVVTDALGRANFSYRANQSGLDTLSVTGLGTTVPRQIAISGEDFKFESPATSTGVAIGASQRVTVRLAPGGAPAAGRVVTFSTTRGVVTPDSAVTDPDGRASANVSSTTAGPASISARSGSAQALLPLTYLATTPSSLVLQANPAAVAPNAAGTSSNQATLQAAVRDASGNPVAGRIVNFTALADLSNGSIVPGTGVTDANGLVSVQFTPGPLSTANNGVVIQATVQGTTVTGTTALTVSSQALFISIGKGATIGVASEPVYKKEFSVYVTDANGAAVPNKAVALSVFGDNYIKGRLFFPALAPTWVVSAELACPNEDRNRNGFLDLGEDLNQSGKLEPGLPVVVTPAAVITDASGFATFFLQYGKNFAWWLDTTISARATVGGTESVQTQKYTLDALTTDINKFDTSPPNVVSPFGTDTSSCTNPN